MLKALPGSEFRLVLCIPTLPISELFSAMSLKTVLEKRHYKAECLCLYSDSQLRGLFLNSRSRTPFHRRSTRNQPTKHLFLLPSLFVCFFALTSHPCTCDLKSMFLRQVSPDSSQARTGNPLVHCSKKLILQAT